MLEQALEFSAVRVISSLILRGGSDSKEKGKMESNGFDPALLFEEDLFDEENGPADPDHLEEARVAGEEYDGDSIRLVEGIGNPHNSLDPDDIVDKFGKIYVVIDYFISSTSEGDRNVEGLQDFGPEAIKFLGYAYQMESDEFRLAFMADVVYASLCQNIAVGVLAILVKFAVGGNTTKSLKEIHERLMGMGPQDVAARGKPTSKRYPRVWGIGKNDEEYTLNESVHNHYKLIQDEIARFLEVDAKELHYEHVVIEPLSDLIDEFGPTGTMKAFETLHWAILGKVRVVYLARISEMGYRLSDAGVDHYDTDALKDLKLRFLSMYRRWLRRWLQRR